MDREDRRFQALRDAVADAYRAFRTYRQDGPILCEMTARVVVPAGVPLRERAAADFERYEWKAITTLGSVDNYKHFLPRLLDLGIDRRRRETAHRDAMTCDEMFRDAHVSLDRVAGKLDYGGAARWPADEAAVLSRFGVARWWWELSLPADCNHGGDPGAALQFLEAIGLPLGPFLDEALGELLDADLAALAGFINRCARGRWKDGRVLRDWSDHPDGGGALAFERWLLSPAFAARLEAAFFVLNDGAGAAASAAAEHLRWMRAARGAT